jgi:hypothetical protein
MNLTEMTTMMTYFAIVMDAYAKFLQSFLHSALNEVTVLFKEKIISKWYIEKTQKMADRDL